jgi:hypothetical protein
MDLDGLRLKNCAPALWWPSCHPISTFCGPVRDSSSQRLPQVICIAGKHAQVAWIVVQPISINVIDNLSRRKIPPKKIVHHYPMDGRISCGVCSGFSALLYCPDQVSIRTIFFNSPQKITVPVEGVSAFPARVAISTHVHATNRQATCTGSLAYCLWIHV